MMHIERDAIVGALLSRSAYRLTLLRAFRRRRIWGRCSHIVLGVSARPVRTVAHKGV
jgi:hypothetical protein